MLQNASVFMEKSIILIIFPSIRSCIILSGVRRPDGFTVRLLASKTYI